MCLSVKPWINMGFSSKILCLLLVALVVPPQYSLIKVIFAGRIFSTVKQITREVMTRLQRLRRKRSQALHLCTDAAARIEGL